MSLNLYSREQVDDANRVLKETADTMEDIRGYVQYKGTYDKFDHIETCLDQASRGHEALNVKLAGIVKNLTDASKSEFYDAYAKRCVEQYQEQQKQQQQTKTIEGPGYKLQQPSNNIIRGQKMQSDSQRAINQAMNEGGKYLGGNGAPDLGPVLQ